MTANDAIISRVPLELDFSFALDSETLHPFFTPLVLIGVNLSYLSWGDRWGTPWTGCSPLIVNSILKI